MPSRLIKSRLKNAGAAQKRNRGVYQWLRVTSLSDLFPAFDELEQGVSLALASADLNESLVSNLCNRHAGGRLPADTKPWSAPRLGVWSSGSTGRPKLVWRSWAQLKKDACGNQLLSRWKWASPFRPNSFAGVQVALQAWHTQGVVLSLSLDWKRNWLTLLENSVDALVCTPTFIELMLQMEEPTSYGWQPSQITLGGEPLRPRAAQRARDRFPRARFTVIYAAAEFGVIAKTHRLDGWYERESFDRHCSPWRIADGVLEIWNQDEWNSTGDCAVAAGDLIRIVGRTNGIANVGGVKVNLEEVGTLAEEVPGVRTAVASLEQNPVVGEVVVLNYSIDLRMNQSEVEANLQNHLRQVLPKEAWPRRWIVRQACLGKNSKRAPHSV